MDKNNKKIKVAVGMSGGVDSTMAAYLLKRQGFDVVGLTMKIWDNNIRLKHSKSGCYGPGEKNDILEAKKIAKKIGIPHYVIDLRELYKKYVLDYFKKEYSCGRTPNPCVVCNSKIKFGYLFKLAQSSGIEFDRFATGHYARIHFDLSENRYILKKGIDKAKDQSYFLYRLTQSQLKKVIFPLGEYRKAEIKRLAEESGYLHYAQKKESQNFIECDDYGVLFKNKNTEGNIVDTEGKILGRHKGIVFYTIGQRKGLNIGGMKEPMYVTKINAKQKEVVVGPKKFLYSKDLVVKNLNWNISKTKNKIKCQAKIRFGSPDVDCALSFINKNRAKVEFKKPQFGIAPGQSAVFYKGDELIGGGIIV